MVNNVVALVKKDPYNGIRILLMVLGIMSATEYASSGSSSPGDFYLPIFYIRSLSSIFCVVPFSILYK